MVVAQILSVSGDVLGNEIDFHYSVLCQLFPFFYDILYGAASEWPFDEGDGAVGASVAAAFSYLYIGPGGVGKPVAGMGVIEEEGVRRGMGF